MKIQPKYHDRFDPVYPCIRMPTRHCPAVYNDVCGERKCARFELELDEANDIWLPEIREDYTP